jgi:acyl-CoA dehydrogenase
VAALITAPSEARNRLMEWVYLTPTANNTIGRMNALLPEVILAEPVDRKFGKALKTGQLKAHDYAEQVAEAERAGLLDASEAALLCRVREAVFEFISVDDFAPEALRAQCQRTPAQTTTAE